MVWDAGSNFCEYLQTQFRTIHSSFSCDVMMCSDNLLCRSEVSLTGCFAVSVPAFVQNSALKLVVQLGLEMCCCMLEA